MYIVIIIFAQSFQVHEEVVRECANGSLTAANIQEAAPRLLVRTFLCKKSLQVVQNDHIKKGKI